MPYLSTLFRRSPERRAYSDLMQLDDRLLRDIGLDRAELRALLAKSRDARARRIFGHE
ncbi:DUF1127 domain-containing protein [Devosia sp.]|uniref:DUF1127 domain-containing protein n=1 Tax=Devosia sp. TaxID=1871048 RepID=UPI002F113634